MAKRFDSLDVVKMRATLTLHHWENVLRKATKSGNIDKLMMYRYGLQAGLADAVKKGLGDEELCKWVLKRIKNVEMCAQHVVRKRNPNQLDDTKCKKDPNGYVRNALEAKRKRDREFQMFLARSNY